MAVPSSVHPTACPQNEPQHVGRLRAERFVPSALRTSDFQDIPSWRRLTVATIDTDNRSVPDIAATILGDVLASDACAFHGFRPLPKRGEPVTNELIDRLREDGHP